MAKNTLKTSKQQHENSREIEKDIYEDYKNWITR